MCPTTGRSCLLRAPLGSATRTDPGLPGEEYAATEILRELPAFRDHLERLPCEIMAARLMRLRPGAKVKEHVDRFLGFDYGKVRLHIPVVTSERAVMVFEDCDAHWDVGTLWYGDFSKTHAVRNDCCDDRTHLVIDCVLNDDLAALFGNGTRPARWLHSRTPMRVATPGPIGLIHRYSVTRSALDWTEAFDWTKGGDKGIEDEVAFEIAILSDQQLVMRLPSGVDATLHPVSEVEYRLGRMPEEITVRFDGHTAAVVRRVGSNMRSWQAVLLDDNSFGLVHDKTSGV